MSEPRPDRTAASALSLVALLACGAVAGPARGEPARSRVLPPKATGVVSSTLARLAPGIAVKETTIDYDHVTAVLCPAEPGSACFSLRLEDPARGCATDVVGAWCVSYAAPAPAPAVRDAVRDAFSREPVDPWITPGGGSGDHPSSAPPAPPPPGLTARVIASALLVLVAPLLAGAIAGVVTRRARGSRLSGYAAATLIPSVIVALAVWVSASWRIVGLWDALAVGSLVAFGFLWTAHRSFEDWRARVVFVASVLMSLVLGEVAVRILLPPAPGFPPAGEARLLLAGRSPMANGGQEVVCNVLYGSGWETSSSMDELSLPDSYAVPPGSRRRVLHLGDSMTYGVGVAREQAFPALLGAAGADALHVNGGVSAIGPDGYLVLLRRWVARLEFDSVVMSLFSGNDLGDIDSIYPCCDGPLLRYESSGPELRCPTPSRLPAAVGLPAYLRVSPPPYLARITTGVSSMAAHVAAGLVRLSQPGRARDAGVTEPAERPEEPGLEHLATILAAARDELARRNVAFVVLVLPMRSALDAPASGERRWRVTADSMLRVARELAIPALDPWDAFEARVRAEGSARYFVDEIHFSAAGHALLADWLRDRLPAAERASRRP